VRQSALNERGGRRELISARIAPGGDISCDGSWWIAERPSFFLPVRVLSKLFRRLMIEKLLAAYAAGRLTFPRRARRVNTEAFVAHLARSSA
jgi:hypothetical protein